MPGVVHRQYYITRADLRQHPDRLYVFGDNLAGRGLGGQAREMRGEPNAVGIPTKRSPFVYLCDDDLSQVREVTARSMARLINHLARGGDVVLPAAGVGTGLAELQRRSPACWTFIQQTMTALEAFRRPE